MNFIPSPNGPVQEPVWLARFVQAEPRAPLMVPYLAYLLMLAVQDFFPPVYWPVLIAAHTAAALWIVRLFRNHYPSLGRPHLPLAILVGLAAAWLWVGGQHLLDIVTFAGHSLGDRLLGYPGSTKAIDPHLELGAGVSFWFYVCAKITRATTAVPIVEELLWRGFLLRAFVSWDRYDKVAWGRFYWRAFIGTALLSTIQHPNNWGVSIACWLLFNLLFYWKKSLLCLMITHAVTNLALYAYVVGSGDWRFW